MSPAKWQPFSSGVNVLLHFLPSLWRHNERDGVSNHQPHDCLLNRLFRRRSKKTSKLRVTGLCEENSPVTGEFPAQRASNAENDSIWWRHHALGYKQPFGLMDAIDTTLRKLKISKSRHPVLYLIWVTLCLISKATRLLIQTFIQTGHHQTSNTDISEPLWSYRELEELSDSPHKGPVMREVFHVITSCILHLGMQGVKKVLCNPSSINSNFLLCKIPQVWWWKCL